MLSVIIRCFVFVTMASMGLTSRKNLLALIFQVPRCEQPRVVGEGNELVARWYYDGASKQCKRFLYKGLMGNPNNFITKTQCVEACESGRSDLRLLLNLFSLLKSSSNREFLTVFVTHFLLKERVF